MLLLETTESENIESDSSENNNNEIGLGIGGLSVQRIDEALRYVQASIPVSNFHFNHDFSFNSDFNFNHNSNFNHDFDHIF